MVRFEAHHKNAISQHLDKKSKFKNSNAYVWLSFECARHRWDSKSEVVKQDSLIKLMVVGIKLCVSDETVVRSDKNIVSSEEALKKL